jgi:hypothetical protein
MAIVPLFPGTANPQKADQDDFEREVAARFGRVCAKLLTVTGDIVQQAITPPHIAATLRPA